jgi:hypothetical protein
MTIVVVSVLLSVSRQVSAKFGTCAVVGLQVNGTLAEAKKFTFSLKYTHFTLNKCTI